MNYLAIIYDEKEKGFRYTELQDVPDAIQKGDAAVRIINLLDKHERLINFWPLWELSIDYIK